MEETFLEIQKDFDLTKYKEVGEFVYQVDFDNSTIVKWMIIGHVLNSSSDKRCFTYHLVRDKFSIYVMRNLYNTLCPKILIQKNYWFDCFEEAKTRLKELLTSKIEENIKLLDNLKED